MNELVHIEVRDVDLDACKIFINRGKGAKDRYILFPASFRLVLKSHLHAAPRNRYLFETRRFGPFTTRRIQQIVQGYREKAGMSQPILHLIEGLLNPADSDINVLEGRSF